MRVLVTSAGGTITRSVVPEMGKTHDLRLLNIKPIEGDPRSVVADITQIDQVLPVMEDIGSRSSGYSTSRLFRR
jgi:hypothetical protein